MEEGKIPKGSELRVEGFDRLSREHVLDAFQSFGSIIRTGIKVITLVDNMEYTKESLNANPAQLMLSLTYMYAAHLESKKKSDWLSNAWSGKRVQAQKKKKRLTKKCPAWLEPQEEGDWFYPIEDRCRVIEQIYSMYDEGKGKRLIEKELNQGDGWKPKNGWRKSYIDKILRNPACIGLFQPHRKLKGKRCQLGIRSITTTLK